MVGPGFSPIPSKLVAQIVTGKYVDFSHLLAANLTCLEPKPKLLLDSQIMLTTPLKKTALAH